jgi:hypothetical protein
MTTPPMTSERPVPMNLSASQPPMSGVRYTAAVYVPYRLLASAGRHWRALTR